MSKYNPVPIEIEWDKTPVMDHGQVMIRTRDPIGLVHVVLEYQGACGFKYEAYFHAQQRGQRMEGDNPRTKPYQYVLRGNYRLREDLVPQRPHNPRIGTSAVAAMRLKREFPLMIPEADFDQEVGTGNRYTVVENAEALEGSPELQQKLENFKLRLRSQCYSPIDDGLWHHDDPRGVAHVSGPLIQPTPSKAVYRSPCEGRVRYDWGWRLGDLGDYAGPVSYAPTCHEHKSLTWTPTAPRNIVSPAVIRACRALKAKFGDAPSDGLYLPNSRIPMYNPDVPVQLPGWLAVGQLHRLDYEAGRKMKSRVSVPARATVWLLPDL